MTSATSRLETRSSLMICSIFTISSPTLNLPSVSMTHLTRFLLDYRLNRLFDNIQLFVVICPFFVVENSA